MKELILLFLLISPPVVAEVPCIYGGETLNLSREDIVRVKDGDTIVLKEVCLRKKNMPIRLRGNAPESKHRAKCDEEAMRAEMATEHLEERIAQAGSHQIQTDEKLLDGFSRVLGGLYLDREPHHEEQFRLIPIKAIQKGWLPELVQLTIRQPQP